MSTCLIHGEPLEARGDRPLGCAICYSEVARIGETASYTRDHVQVLGVLCEIRDLFRDVRNELRDVNDRLREEG